MKRILKLLLAIVVLAAVAFLLTRQIDLDKALKIGGPLILALILFAETGLLIGFFLPGDTLLFAAGFFAAQGRINLVITLLILFVGTSLGNMVGYEIGKRSGPRVFKREEALFFNPENIDKAQKFYKQHGGKTILIARFVPIIRTLAPLLAGIGKMNYRIFTMYNLLGGAIWVSAITMIGYWAGRVVGHYFNIDKFILPVVAFATILTLSISFWHIWRDPHSRQQLKTATRQRWADYLAYFKK